MKRKKYLNMFAINYKYMLAVEGETLSDEDFFMVLKHCPLLLQTSVAIDKILLWQKELNDKNKSFRVQENLKRIGTTLALKKQRKAEKKLPPGYNPQTACYSFRKGALKEIKKAGISKYRNEANKKKRLKELFGPRLIDKFPDIPKTDAKIANMITAGFFGYTLYTVERYIKGAAKIPVK